MVMVDLASVTVAESVGRHVKGPSKRFNSLTESQGKKFLAAPSMGNTEIRNTFYSNYFSSIFYEFSGLCYETFIDLFASFLDNVLSKACCDITEFFYC